MTDSAPTPETLRRKQRAVREDGRHSFLALRTHRAVRWLYRATRARDDKDADVAFILYWIAFNAAYAKDVSWQSPSTRDEVDEYFDRLVSLDENDTIHSSIWDRFSGPVRTLLNNEYLFDPFWDHANGKPGNADWEERFKKAGRAALAALANNDTKTVLSILFQRLYTLRNQVVHGGASWNSSLNRDSVEDGARIMEFLVPIFIDIMLDNPDEDWGPPHYRVFPRMRIEQREEQ